MNFKDLGIIEPILKALEEQGYTAPSPIQEKAIPHLLQGKDLLGCAQTGTGKTAAFAIPILQELAATKKGSYSPIRALILTPTRELAMQIHESFGAYGKFLGLRSCAIYGGVSQKAQVEQLRRGVDIVVATPGRLMDLYTQGLIHYTDLTFFVLDEADRMLDMGFVHDVKKIIKTLPPKRQSLLFSATMPAEVKGLVNSILNNYVTVEVTPVSSTVDTIEQSLYYVDKGNKQLLLIDLLKDKSVESALVFTRTKHGADKVVKELTKANIKAQAIHGNKSQTARQLALNNFKTRKIQVLVATDIAARGIDIDELSHVVNYDLPEVPETYVHRIGRTGRAGLSGKAISFCMFDEFEYLRNIEKLISKKIPVVEGHKYPLQVMVATPKEPRQPRSRTNSFGMDKSAVKAAVGRQQKRPEKKAKADYGAKPSQRKYQDYTKKKKTATHGYDK